MDRYARQSVFSPIGLAGQEKIKQARLAIIGMGALGTVAANNLVRSGVGFVRIIDRDYVELTNLQRQLLYSEADVEAGLPKVIAAASCLQKINSEIIIEPIIADVNTTNIEAFIKDVDLVLDATDNFDIRLLINEACNKHKIPWIYCAALGAEGMSLTITQQPNTPCFRCFMGNTKSSGQTCSSFGVLNMTTMTMASLQSAEALKFFVEAPLRKELLAFDLWDNQFHTIPIQQNPGCPVCVHHQYEHLGKVTGAYSTSLCGTDSIQIVPGTTKTIDLADKAEQLKKIGSIHLTPYFLKFEDAHFQIMLFPDGRAIIKGAKDEKQARSIYTEYIG